MVPFEALYGRRCRTPLSWSKTGERKILGPDLVTEAEEKVKVIQRNLKAAQFHKRLIMIRERNHWNLMWETMYTCESNRLEECKDLELKAS